MKKGDRIRCIKDGGALAKGMEGICFDAGDGRYGCQAKFDLYGENIYSLGEDWTTHFEVIQSDSALAIQKGGTQKLDRFLVFAWDKGRAKGGANDLVLDTPKYELAINHVSTHHDHVQIVDSELGITLYQK